MPNRRATHTLQVPKSFKDLSQDTWQSALYRWQTLNPFATDRELAAKDVWLCQGVRWLFWMGLCLGLSFVPAIYAALGGVAMVHAVVVLLALVAAICVDTWRHYPYYQNHEDVSHWHLMLRGIIVSTLLIAVAYLLFPTAVPAAIASVMSHMGMHISSHAVWGPMLMLIAATALAHLLLVVFYRAALASCRVDPTATGPTPNQRLARALVALVFVAACTGPAIYLLAASNMLSAGVIVALALMLPALISAYTAIQVVYAPQLLDHRYDHQRSEAIDPYVSKMSGQLHFEQEDESPEDALQITIDVAGNALTIACPNILSVLGFANMDPSNVKQVISECIEDWRVAGLPGALSAEAYAALIHDFAAGFEITDERNRQLDNLVVANQLCILVGHSHPPPRLLYQFIEEALCSEQGSQGGQRELAQLVAFIYHSLYTCILEPLGNVVRYAAPGLKRRCVLRCEERGIDISSDVDADGGGHTPSDVTENLHGGGKAAVVSAAMPPPSPSRADVYSNPLFVSTLINSGCVQDLPLQPS